VNDQIATAGLMLLVKEPDMVEFSYQRSGVHDHLGRLGAICFQGTRRSGLHPAWLFLRAVMDRIHGNAIPIDRRLQNSASWKRLRLFQTSKKEEGLKRLLQPCESRLDQVADVEEGESNTCPIRSVNVVALRTDFRARENTAKASRITASG